MTGESAELRWPVRVCSNLASSVLGFYTFAGEVRSALCIGTFAAPAPANKPPCAFAKLSERRDFCSEPKDLTKWLSWFDCVLIL